MSFVKDWNTAIENDPYWKFEDLLEEDPELAEYLWNETRIYILAKNRLGI